MNWTGGTLGRSRNAKTSLTAIQKAHFAKARGRLESTHISLPTLEIFGNVFTRAKGNNEGHRRPPRTWGGSCNNVNNQDLWSDRQPQVGRHREPKRKRVSHSEESMPRHQSQSHPQNATGSSPITISSRPPSSVSNLKEDGYGSLEVHSKHRLQEPADGTLNSAFHAIEAQRARLLDTRDWVGILHTKPAKIRFTDSNDRDQIGKRRRLSIINPYGSQQNPRYSVYQRPQQNFLATNDHLSQADISVRIGSAVDRRSARYERSRRSLSKWDHTSTLSDEMLLDDNFSHQSASFQNPFRERPFLNHFHSPQHTRSQNGAFTPSAFTEKLGAFHAGDLSKKTTADGHRDPGLARQRVPQSRPFNEPMLVFRKPNGGNFPIRFAFENTPCPRHSSSSSDSLRERTLRNKYSNSKPKRKTLQKAQRQPSTIPPLSVQDSLSGLESCDTSPLTRETRDYLIQLRDHDSRSPRDTEKLQKAAPPTSSQEEHLDPGRETTDQGLSGLLSQPPANPVAFSPCDVPKDEEGGWKRFIDDDSAEQPAPPEALPTSRATALLDKFDQHAIAEETVKTQAQDPQAPADEEENLWRSFVFGEDDPPLDWMIETQEGSEANVIGPKPSAIDSAARTQTSMEAEVATSPIKQNAHLVEAMTSSSSLAAKTNGALHIAAISSTSQANSDEMLDGGFQQNSSSSLHSLLQDNEPTKISPIHPAPSSSNIAQASTSPLTTTDPRTSNTHTSVPSSLIAQASNTPKMPEQPSSDELAWSPGRTFQPTAKSAVVFKKPARYVGEHSSDPVEPVRLGGKRIWSTNSRKKEKGFKGPAREKAKEDEIWEIGAERDEVLEDEIEDD